MLQITSNNFTLFYNKEYDVDSLIFKIVPHFLVKYPWGGVCIPAAVNPLVNDKGQTILSY